MSVTFGYLTGAQRCKFALIAHEKLTASAAYQSYDSFRRSHKRWVDESLASCNNVYAAHWTSSITAGRGKRGTSAI
jgi:hypothetical protein